MDSTTIYTQVHSRYGATARATPSSKYADTVAQAFGYSAEELASIPSDSNLGLSCGNPLALASLKDGETMIDLGCGAGFDVFLAARRIGDKGKVVGVDMNEVSTSPLAVIVGDAQMLIADRICSPKPDSMHQNPTPTMSHSSILASLPSTYQTHRQMSLSQTA